MRASSARSMYSLPAAPFAGSPANGRAEEAGGGSSPAPGKRPRHKQETTRKLLHKLRSSSSSCQYSNGRTNSHVKLEKSAESGSTFDGTRSITGRVARPLARTPGSLIPAVTVAGRTGRPTEDALRELGGDEIGRHFKRRSNIMDIY